MIHLIADAKHLGLVDSIRRRRHHDPRGLDQVCHQKRKRDSEPQTFHNVAWGKLDRPEVIRGHALKFCQSLSGLDHPLWIVDKPGGRTLTLEAYLITGEDVC